MALYQEDAGVGDFILMENLDEESFLENLRVRFQKVGNPECPVNRFWDVLTLRSRHLIYHAGHRNVSTLILEK